MGFGSSETLDDGRIIAAERYLVNVVKNCASEVTFDQLRCSQYLKNDSMTYHQHHILSSMDTFQHGSIL